MAHEVEFPRLGHAYVPCPDEVRVPALLTVERDRGVRLEIALSGEDDAESPIVTWLRSDRPEAVEVTYRDVLLDVHLVATRPTGYTGHPSGPSTGYARADFAIEDRDQSGLGYSEVHEMRTQIGALHDFMGWQLAESEHVAPQGRLAEVVHRTVRVPAERIGHVDGFDVHIDPQWWSDHRPHRHSEIRQQTWLRTASSEPRPVSEHARVHERVRDLLALATWTRTDITEAEVQHHLGPAVAIDGSVIDRAWRTVHTSSLRRGEVRRGPDAETSWVDTRPPASFAAIGCDGVWTWLTSSASLHRAADPLIALLFAVPTTPESALLQSGIAAEAMGFHLLARDLGSRRAGDAGFRVRLECILASSALPIAELFEDDGAAWSKAAADAYNGVKHADRALPDPALASLVAHTLAVLLQGQLLVELGVPPATVGQLSTHHSWWGLREAYERFARDLMAQTEAD